jgi:DNA-binding MarR family transcriptional regulator
MLDGLERAGYVTRATDVKDRRCVVVALTPDGRTALEVTSRTLNANRRRISTSLSDEDREQAARLLRRLARIVEEQLP